MIRDLEARGTKLFTHTRAPRPTPRWKDEEWTNLSDSSRPGAEMSIPAYQWSVYNFLRGAIPPAAHDTAAPSSPAEHPRARGDDLRHLNETWDSYLGLRRYEAAKTTLYWEGLHAGFTC